MSFLVSRFDAICLISNNLLNLADNFLDFSGILLIPAVSLQVRISGKFAGLLPDCAFDFVQLACGLIVRALFHFDSRLIRWVVSTR